MEAYVKLKEWALADHTKLILERLGERLVLQVRYGSFVEGHDQRGPEIFLTGDLAESVGRALIDYSVQP